MKIKLPRLGICPITPQFWPQEWTQNNSIEHITECGSYEVMHRCNKKIASFTRYCILRLMCGHVRVTNPCPRDNEGNALKMLSFGNLDLKASYVWVASWLCLIFSVMGLHPPSQEWWQHKRWHGYGATRSKSKFTKSEKCHRRVKPLPQKVIIVNGTRDSNSEPRH